MTSSEPRRRCPLCGLSTNEELCPQDQVSTLLIDAPASHGIHVGSILAGRYVVERLIGRGGFGSVFQARHTGTGQSVAIKTLGAGLESDPLALRRFFQEARVTAGLKHPNTIRVFDFGQDESGTLFLAMELLTGVSLRHELKHRLKNDRVFTEREAIDLGDAVARSLTEAHAAGLVHRDLKPDNIFLHRIEGEAPIVKVLDFGIVKLADSELTMGSDSGVPGTPAYMSPEQVSRKDLDQRSDLYSLAIVLYSMVTGVVPFRGKDALHTLYMHVHEPVPDIMSRHRTPISDRFAALIHRTLSKDAAQRPQDAKEFRALLQSCIEGQSVPQEWRGESTVFDRDPPPRSEALALLADTPLEEYSRSRVEPTEELTFTPRGEPSSKAPPLKEPPLAPGGLLAPPEPPRPTAGPGRMKWLAAGAAALIALGITLGVTQQGGLLGVKAPERPKLIALLPFDDRSRQVSLDFARAGLPFLLGSELSRVPGLDVIGYYKLKSSIGDEAAPREKWIEAARTRGAELLVFGDLEPIGPQVRATVILSRIDGTELRRWTWDRAADEVPRAVQNAAQELASTALGREIPFDRPTGEFEYHRVLAAGVAALESHQLAEAFALLERAAVVNYASADAYYYLSVASWWLSHPAAKTQGYIERALKIGPSHAQRAFLEGLALLVERRYPESITHFRAAAVRHPDDRDVLYGLSEALFHGGHPREGVEAYRRTVLAYPQFKLGLVHAMTFAIANADEDVLAWAHPLISSGPHGLLWDVRTDIAHRKYNKALESLLSVVEGKRDTAPEVGRMAESELFSAYVAAGQLDMAQLATERWNQGTIGGKLPHYTLAVARGDTAKARVLRAETMIFVDSLAPSSVAIEELGYFIQADLPHAEPSELAELEAKYLKLLPPELARDPRPRLVLRLLRARQGKSYVDPEKAPPSPDAEAIDRAVAARAARRAKQAADAFAAATRGSGDGRFVMLLHLLAAEQYREAGAPEEVVQHCVEITSPRFVMWDWGGSISPCLAYTVDAEMALGHTDLANKALQRLRATRTAAPLDDRWLTLANKAMER